MIDYVDTQFYRIAPSYETITHRLLLSLRGQTESPQAVS
jgi:hypothetical protein